MFLHQKLDTLTNRNVFLFFDFCRKTISYFFMITGPNSSRNVSSDNLTILRHVSIEKSSILILASKICWSKLSRKLPSLLSKRYFSVSRALNSFMMIPPATLHLQRTIRLKIQSTDSTASKSGDSQESKVFSINLLPNLNLPFNFRAFL